MNALLSWLLTFFAPVPAELVAPVATAQVRGQAAAPTGPVPNTAARSSSEARPGEVLLGFLDISNGF